MTIVFFNDTSNNPHIGCQAVTDAQDRFFGRHGQTIIERYYNTELKSLATEPDEKAIVRAIRESPVATAIEKADAVVVNGEGTIHHGRGLELLGVLAVAQQQGKQAHLINAVLEEVPAFYETLRQLDSLTVRDAASARYLDGLNIPHRVLPDSIIDARFSDQPLFRFDGRVLVTDWHGHLNSTTGRVVTQFMNTTDNRIVFYPLRRTDAPVRWRYALAEMRTADCIVTARHHGAYLAAMAGRPFVMLASNTHKMKGFIELAGMDIPYCSSADEIEAGIRYARDHARHFRELQQRLMDYGPLEYFDGTADRGRPVQRVVDRERLRRLIERKKLATAVALCVDYLHTPKLKRQLESCLTELAKDAAGLKPLVRFFRLLTSRVTDNTKILRAQSMARRFRKQSGKKGKRTLQARVANLLAARQQGRVIDSSDAVAQYDAGSELLQQERFGQAAPYLSRAVQLDPACEDYLVQLASCYKKQYRYGESVEVFEHLNTLDPHSRGYRYGLAHAQLRAGLHQQALRTFDERLAMQPDSVHRKSHYHRGEILVHLGDYANGWAEIYDYLPKAQHKAMHPPLGLELWDGAAPLATPLLLWSDTNQGVGEELMFSSIILDLLARGIQCCLIVDERLVAPLSRSLPGAEVVGRPVDPGAFLQGKPFTHYLPLRVLARYFRTRLSDFQGKGAYLVAGNDQKQDGHKGTAAMRVGLSWRTVNPRTGFRRSIDLAAMRPWLDKSGISYINLQYGEVDDDLAKARAAGWDIEVDDSVDPMADPGSLLDLIQSLDLVISIDNSTVHMAGALGQACWCLQPSPAFWVWPRDGRHSVWYDSVEMFRQPCAGDWKSVLEEVSDRLVDRVQQGCTDVPG